MDFRDSPSDAEWRSQARTWLEANAEQKTPHQRDRLRSILDEPDDPDYVSRSKAWQQKLYEGGYAAITWPKQFGGLDASPMQAFIFSDEMSNFDVPSGLYTIGLGMIGPTIISHGTKEQQDKYLPKMQDGSEIWCQLWSEPNAGSDVASLQSKAVQDEATGDWRLNGQKVWTTGAQHSKWGLIITRTNVDVPKHQGISCFIIDMQQPGVTVRPLRQPTGGTSFNEVFFDDAKIEASQLVGDLNDGWRVALTTLMNERFAIGVGGARGASLQPLFTLAKQTPHNGGHAIDDFDIRQQLASTYISMRLLGLTGYRALTKISKGGIPGPEGSAMKLVGTKLASQFADAGSRILGMRAALRRDDLDEDIEGWSSAYLSAPGIHVAGGTDEIMKNIIGERVLGLPKEPSVDRDVAFKDLRTSN